MDIQSKLEEITGESLVVTLRYGTVHEQEALEVTAITMNGHVHQKRIYISGILSYNLEQFLRDFGDLIKKTTEYRELGIKKRRAEREMRRIEETFPGVVK